MATMDLERLLDLEDRRRRSLCNGRGSEFYGELMTEDSLMVLVNAEVLDRASVLQSMSDTPAWDDSVITDPRPVVLGDPAAVLA